MMVGAKVGAEAILRDMEKRGLIKKVDADTYQITPKGLLVAIKFSEADQGVTA